MMSSVTVPNFPIHPFVVSVKSQMRGHDLDVGPDDHG